MKKFLTLTLLSIAIFTEAQAGVSRSSGYRGGGYSGGGYRGGGSYRSNTTVINRTYVNRGGGFSGSGLVTGMVLGSMMSNHHNGGYHHVDYNSYNSYGAMPSGYHKDLCRVNRELYDLAIRTCGTDMMCFNTYCYR